MSEGAMFPWKRQEIDASRGPAASYDNIHKPLPAPPKNMYWVVDPKTREWRLEEKSPEEATTAEATLVDSDNDILYHKIQPNDTFQGICLKYKLTPTELRQANGGFSGTNLYLAPNPLRIPRGNVVLATATAVSSQTTGESNDTKVRKLRDACPQLHGKEAKCYLELNNWDYKEALANAKDDGF